MNLLALDLATKTGVAAARGSDIYFNTTLDFKPRCKALDPLTRQARIFDRASLAISDLIDEHMPSVVVLEDSGSNLKGQAARVLLGLRAIALVVCWRREILVDPISSSEWKAWARQRWWTPEDKNDASDARWMLAHWIAVRAERIKEAA